MPFSVAVITLNEADRIAACLDSAAFADEVVVVDAGSRDDTVGIAQSLGCRVLHREWDGFARQKQFAVDQCRNDWVLVLDADERIPEETAIMVQQRMRAPEPNIGGYLFRRKNYFHGRWIRYCGWWPNLVLRLVDRRQGSYSPDLVHEKWDTARPVVSLDSDIEHYSFRNYADLIQKMQVYSTLAARQMKEKGHRASGWSPMTHGLWMFIHTYFLERGFMGGFDGFVISLLNAQGSFMKYAKLREACLNFDPTLPDRQATLHDGS